MGRRGAGAKYIYICEKRAKAQGGRARNRKRPGGARARALSVLSWLSLCAGLSGLRGRVLVGVLGRGSFFILFQSPNSHITSRSQGGHSVSDTSTRFSPTALPPSSTIESSCVHRCGRVLIARCRTWYRPLRAASPVCPSDPSRRSPWSSAPPAPRPAAPPPRPCCHLGCHGARYVRA